METGHIKLDDVDIDELEDDVDELEDDASEDEAEAQQPQAPSSEEINRLREEHARMQGILSNIAKDERALEFIKRRAAGEQLDFTDPNQNPQPKGKAMNVQDFESQEEEVDVDVLDNKGLVKFMTKNIQGMIQPMIQQLEAKVDQKIGGVEGFVQESKRSQLQSTIQQVRKENKDFDNYRVDMLKLSEAHPTLGVEELYYLAKSRRGGWKATEEPNPSTEKPTNTSTRTPKPKSEPSRGRQGFQNLLAEALGNVDLSKINDL